jgi:hypothetical protein
VVGAGGEGAAGETAARGVQSLLGGELLGLRFSPFSCTSHGDELVAGLGGVGAVRRSIVWSPDGMAVC